MPCSSELFRLVGERAKAEAAANRHASRNDAKVDAEYAKTRQGLVAKYAAARSRGPPTPTNSGDGRSSTPRSRARPEAKAEFAAVSRRIASEFDGLRETAKTEHNRAKNEAASAARGRQQESRRRARTPP